MTQMHDHEDDGEGRASPARRLLWVWMGLAGAATMAAQAEFELRALAVPAGTQLAAPAAPPERVRVAGDAARPDPHLLRAAQRDVPDGLPRAGR